MKRALMVGLCVVLLGGSASAADTKYSEWGGSSGTLEALISRLNELIDEAERARAADPRFLSDLRDAIAGHERPWQREVLRDDFRDGDYTSNPAWNVAEGNFTVESGLGLRSVVRPAQAASSSQSEDTDSKDIAKTLLSALLKKKPSKSESAASEPGRAEIYLSAPITNAFAVEFDLVSREKTGRFTIDVFQGQSRDTGYRLIYSPAGAPSLELLRFSSRGTAIIDSYAEKLELEDGYRHRIQLTRNQQAVMSVTVDGSERVRIADRSFRDPFDGITVANEGGDYAIREISVLGTE